MIRLLTFCSSVRSTIATVALVVSTPFMYAVVVVAELLGD